MFSIAGRGTVVTGRVERGVITKGGEVEITGYGPTQKTTITGVEMFHKGIRQMPSIRFFTSFHARHLHHAPTQKS